MRKLVVLILIALGVLLVTPPAAFASSPTLKSLARASRPCRSRSRPSTPRSRPLTPRSSP